MAFELKDGYGALFINDKKGVENRPDRRGDLMLNGVLYEVAGWIKQGKNGPWLSINVKPKEAKPEPVAETTQRDPDDDIPL